MHNHSIDQGGPFLSSPYFTAIGHTPGFAFFRMQREFSEILGRKADFNTPQDLSRYIRAEILAEAEVLYDAARSASSPTSHA